MTVQHRHLSMKSGELEGTECNDPACPMTWGCRCGPDERCFECATDDEMSAAIGPFPAC